MVADDLEGLALRLGHEVLGRELLGEGEIDAAIDQIGMDLVGIFIADRLQDAGVIFAHILILRGAGIDADPLALDVGVEILDDPFRA